MTYLHLYLYQGKITYRISKKRKINAYKTNKRKNIRIGDFYGVPTSAVITYNEKFVIMGGYGLIIYKLEEPFTEFRYGQATHQYKELFRSSDNVKWIDVLYQTDKDETRDFFRMVISENPDEVYRMNAQTYEIEKI